MPQPDGVSSIKDRRGRRRSGLTPDVGSSARVSVETLTDHVEGPTLRLSQGVQLSHTSQGAGLEDRATVQRLVPRTSVVLPKLGSVSREPHVSLVRAWEDSSGGPRRVVVSSL